MLSIANFLGMFDDKIVNLKPISMKMVEIQL